MPSTYTASGIELIGDGEQSGTWGDTTNTNLQILDRMLSQAGAISLSGTTHTLTVSDGVLSDGQYAVLVFVGSPTGTNTVTISPNDAQRVFIVKNSSGESVIISQGTGTSVTVADGRSAIVYCDGAGSGAAVVDVSSAFVTPAISDIGALTPADGNFIVGDGTTWVAESGNTALASLGVTATAAELNLLEGVTWTLADYNTLTATAAELNLLDGVTWTLTDYNTLTATAAELNLLDGKSLSGSDTEIVTGTAGTAGDIVQWNADGDLVSYGAATQTEATWETGTSTTESLVSPAKVKAAVDSFSLGVGQTWQDVSASRSGSNTAYQNTTGKPIMVSVSSLDTSTVTVSLSSDGSTWVSIAAATADRNHPNTQQFIVPNTHYYRVNAVTIYVWAELR